MKCNVKIIPLLLLLAINGATPLTAAAKEPEIMREIVDELAQDSIIKEKAEYLNFVGVIKEVNKEYASILVKNDADEIYFNVHESIIMLDGEGNRIASDSLEEGQEILLAYDINTPVAISLPARITPEIAVLMPSSGSAKVDGFDKNYLSYDGGLKLNVSYDTPIYDMNGAILRKEDAAGNILAVFYTIATFSIPPQTPPDKIIVIKATDVQEQSMDSATFYGEDFFITDGIKMIPLAKTGAEYGYEVEWNGKTRTVTLSKGNVSYTITIGDSMYGYNRSVRYFSVAPEIRNDRTYVPEEFLDALVK